MKEQTAICPECNNIIELEEEKQVGDIVVCSNYPCFWEGIVDEIDKEGNIWFKKDSK